MASDFSRTLALLRREKKISQRVAAIDLGVSQALLSHYENGLREPGLSFVVRAAEYYEVSCDYLLGCSMERSHTATDAEHSVPTDGVLQQNRLVQAIYLLQELARQTQSTQLSGEVETYLSITIYKAYRYLFMSDPSAVDAIFRARRDQYEPLCDACQKLTELRLQSAAKGNGGFGLTSERLSGAGISPNDFSAQYPGLSSALLDVLQRVSDLLAEVTGTMENATQKKEKNS